MKLGKVFLVVLVGLALLLPAVSMAQQRSYTLAVVPQLRVSEIYEKWTPLLKKLSQEMGVEIKLTPYNSMGQFETDLRKGVPDFVYMNPYEAMQVKDSPGYLPIVRDKATLSGILVAHKGRGINSVRDLNGKELAFPTPNNFAASLYLRALLTEQEKIQFTPNYVKTHSNVYRTVSLDKAAAGGGVKKTLMQEPDDVKNQLTIIYETPAVASHPLAAHKRIPVDVRNRMASTIMKLGGDPASKQLLTNIQMPDPIEADYQQDYLPLKKLKLEKYAEKETD